MPKDRVTVKQLINTLKTLDPDAQIILSRDAEGNEYQPMCAYSKNMVFVIDGETGKLVPRINDNKVKTGFVTFWPLN